MVEKPNIQGVTVQSVCRALDILACFENNAELGLTEIASMMGLSKSTVYGLVNTLAGYGFLEQTDDTKKYKLGVSLLEYGNRVLNRIDIRSEAKALCAPLTVKYPATLHIATHSGGDVIYLDKISRGDSIINTSNVGLRAPMYCTGVGKAMLANLPAEYLSEYIRFPLKARTEHTITDKKIFMQELAKVKQQGYAFDNEEVELGVSCVAVPVFRSDGSPALALSLSFANNRIRDVDQKELISDLLNCSRILSARSGYMG